MCASDEALMWSSRSVTGIGQPRYAARESAIDVGWRVQDNVTLGWIRGSHGRRFIARSTRQEAEADATWLNDVSTPRVTVSDPDGCEYARSVPYEGVAASVEGAGAAHDHPAEPEDERMGSVVVDQIGPDGELVSDVDTTLSEHAKNELLLDVLPGARAVTYAGARVVRFRDQVILKAQVTHLGYPWPAYKKRIQIPKSWLEVERQATRDGLVTRFVGIYRYRDVSVFVDFDPRTYVQRSANNSAAHVATNDLYQAQTLGVFERVDRNGNRLTSVHADRFADYLLGVADTTHPSVDVFRRFNEDFLTGDWLHGLDAVKEMYAASWPDRFQNEWAGFYLEYRFDRFVRTEHLTHTVQFQKVKQRGRYDYDLVFPHGTDVEFYGDLKASSRTTTEAIGNDSADLNRCIDHYGRFWYVIYEHETVLGKTNADAATIEWNEWRRLVGHVQGKEYSPLSYATKYKERVRFVRMVILEVNRANAALVLGDYKQGKQQSGDARNLKVKILKKHIDNFLIFSDSVPWVGEQAPLA